MRTPISIITGYLGSGKTTLLRRILEEAERRVAIIMNEFGVVAIDGRVIRGKDVNMVELAGGCVCCSLVGEFEAAIREIINKVGPELIIAETTGVAEPDALLVNVEESLPELQLDSVVTVVDADGMTRFPSLGHTGRAQIEMGDIILINKVDLLGEGQLEEVEKKVRGLNGRAILFRTYRCKVNTKLLFGIYAEKALAERGRGHLEGMQHFSLSTEGMLDIQRFEEFLSSLPKEVYRAKGFVRFPNGGQLFNYVAGRWDFEPFDAERTEAVFIGEGIRPLQEDIEKDFKECFVSGTIWATDS